VVIHCTERIATKYTIKADGKEGNTAGMLQTVLDVLASGGAETEIQVVPLTKGVVSLMTG